MQTQTLSATNYSVFEPYHGMFDLLTSSAPGRPCIIPEECSCQNNSVTIAWTPYLGGVVEAYTLELDDGNGGDFRVSSFH